MRTLKNQSLVLSANRKKRKLGKGKEELSVCRVVAPLLACHVPSNVVMTTYSVFYVYRSV